MGWQGANATLHAIRSVVHALRGWPTPFGIALNTRELLFDDSGECFTTEVAESTRLMASQLVGFASRHR
jgi:FMN reductase